MRRTRWAYIGSLLLILATSASARAQAAPTAAAASGDWLVVGELAFAQGRFGDALDAFEASYRTQQLAHTLRRIGDAADKLGSHARAAQAWQAYLKNVPDAPDREYIETRIDANHDALDAIDPVALSISAAPVTAASDRQAGRERARGPELPAPAAPRLATAGASSDPAHRNAAGPVWLWAVGGAAVVAGIVIAAVVISAGASSSAPESVPGNVGSAIQTLGSR